MSLLVQGTSLPWAARWLKVEVPAGFMPKNRSLLGLFAEDDFETFVYSVKGGTLDGVELRCLRFPSGARIAALFRGRKLIHPSGSTQLKEGDQLCIIGRESDLPVLSKMFNSDSQPDKEKNRTFFGDFTLSGDAPLKDIADLYGLTISPEQAGLTLSELLIRRFGGQTVVGDQMDWHGIRWVVVEVENNKIQQVGLKPLNLEAAS